MNLVKGDLLEMAEAGHFDVIVQGCNCFCTMNSGLAGQIRNKYPQAYQADCVTTKGDPKKLGEFTVAQTEKFTIVNAYTQFDYNKKGQAFQDRFEYQAFEQVLNRLYERMVWSKTPRRFGFPMIGMGLAGGDKNRIIAQLEEFARQVEAVGGSVTLVEYA